MHTQLQLGQDSIDRCPRSIFYSQFFRAWKCWWGEFKEWCLLTYRLWFQWMYRPVGEWILFWPKSQSLISCNSHLWRWGCLWVWCLGGLFFFPCVGIEGLLSTIRAGVRYIEVIKYLIKYEPHKSFRKFLFYLYQVVKRSKINKLHWKYNFS